MISSRFWSRYTGIEPSRAALSESLMTRVTTARRTGLAGLFLLPLVLLTFSFSGAFAADEPDLIFRRSTVFKLMSPNDKLAT